MGFPQGFGQAVFRTADDDVLGQPEIHSVTRRDKNGLDSGPGAEANSHLFIVPIPVFGPGSGLLFRKAEREKRTLGAADRRDIQLDPDMGSQAHSPGMSDPVPVKNRDIRTMPQSPEGGKEGGRFAEGKKTGDVGHFESPDRGGGLDRTQIGESHDDDNGRDPIFIPAVTEIRSRDKPDLAAPPLEDETSGEILLSLNRFL